MQEFYPENIYPLLQKLQSPLVVQDLQFYTEQLWHNKLSIKYSY